MQSLETKSSRPRPKSFETETKLETFETRLQKTGLETETKPRDSITARYFFFLLKIQARNCLFEGLDWASNVRIWERMAKN